MQQKPIDGLRDDYEARSIDFNGQQWAATIKSR
jgi:hypothetical protein